MSTDIAIIKIMRFDSGDDKEAHLQTYEVPPVGWVNKKVVDTLRYIYENLDPTLAFREPCRQRLCGACTVTVNDKSVLSCDAMSEKSMVIGPMAKRPVIKDLVVDMSFKED